MRCVAYIVIESIDLSAKEKIPLVTLLFGAGRRTVKWRGRKFSLSAPRVAGIA